jgi:phosphoribosylanthranilate isomerase
VNYQSIEIKICGLTCPEEAAACVEAGADAIGVIFYPPSPRYVLPTEAGEISRAVERVGAAIVGVFVDESVESICRIADSANLSAVQLHGEESPEMVAKLIDSGLHVVKVLKTTGAELLADAARYPSAGILVECGKGVLPGGNGATWDFAGASVLSGVQPFGIAGGLDLSTINHAVAEALPDAVDLSSGVEIAPGSKDLRLVEHVIWKLKQIRLGREMHRVFGPVEEQ